MPAMSFGKHHRMHRVLRLKLRWYTELHATCSAAFARCIKQSISFEALDALQLVSRQFLLLLVLTVLGATTSRRQTKGQRPCDGRSEPRGSQLEVPGLSKNGSRNIGA